jgi:transcriptional regulator with XRE-family HTH domain
MGFTDIYTILGRAIARRRETLGLTQAEVALRIGLTRASLANIETGRQKVLLHHIYMLADALQFESITDLVPPMLGTANVEPLRLSTDKVTSTQKAQVMSVVRQALTPKTAKRR